MPADPDVIDLADALLTSVGVLVRRVRQLPTDGDLAAPQRSVLAQLERGGPSTSAELARAAQISPQSMGSTLAALTERGLVRRDHDQADGRRVVLSVTADGVRFLKSRRSTRSQQLAPALTEAFTAAERSRLLAAAALIERLAHTI